MESIPGPLLSLNIFQIPNLVASAELATALHHAQKHPEPRRAEKHFILGGWMNESRKGRTMELSITAQEVLKLGFRLFKK
jgi:hypothetical protein